MRWKKALLSLFLAFAVVISTVSLGWSTANKDQDDMKIYSLHLFFALYVFVISARSILQDTVYDHSVSVLHLTTLLTVAFLLLGSAAILPDSPSMAVSIDDESVLLGRRLWYALLGIYTIGCILGYSTPLGPPLHYPPSDIYSEKTIKSITNKDERNVCGITGMHLFFLFEVLITYRFRCLSVGYLAIVIYDQSRLAWKYRRKPRYWGFTNSSCEPACHLQLCMHEESSSRNQAQDILLESCTGQRLAPDLAPDPLELCDTSSGDESQRHLCRPLLFTSLFFAEIRPIPRG